ncbi:MAG: antibiotic biosynthesis monooxygenase family protein [Nostoc sp. DedVER02]|uniref:antibiotic biosynthesis monooxygenase family protein n=1 Tax=unclassified Nostoc TaxID=2593658 RepID=UPI002AD3DC42|nr:MULTISPECIES: antibiotic biosynthesis monooxygenase family protein [unclassified Nostoc]MDZ7987859.1 antibiotic biosynthesis monooxygenase family protein [Nostoc sp. DedVER02]MDZ8116229.1 antibiotic biosynthesis monooxygenase family protein [Nostoc sp. DedVER01b]
MIRLSKFLGNLCGLTVSILILPLAVFSDVEPFAVLAQTIPKNPASNQSKKVVARIWHGTTLTSKADEYYSYLVEAGIKKIQSIPGNLGVQVLRRINGNSTEFTVISYWESRDAIRKFAGNDIEKVRPLSRDNEYLIKPETQVKHFDVLLDDRK